MKKITFFRLVTFLIASFHIVTVFGQTNTPTNFNEGAAVIDMGILPQTDNNALRPYGLVYELVKADIPVYWIINPNKSFVNAGNKVDQEDITISGKTTRTGNISTGSINLKAGPFLIAAEFIADAGPIIESWVGTNPGLTVYWQLEEIMNAPVQGVITTFPNIVIYPKDGDLSSTKDTDIEVGFYNRAGISQGFRLGLPGDITSCDQFYVLSHHTDPDENWTQDDINDLYDFVVGGGNVWMGCHDVSISESYLTTSGRPDTNLNFLSTNGLMPYKDTFGTPVHVNEFDNNLIEYTISSASDPIMQFIGEIHNGLDGNSEKIYLPLSSGWRSSTTVGFYDPTHPDIPTNSPGQAAIIAYGPAYGNSNYGQILYQGSHISKIDTKNGADNEDWVGEARLFGNFLLQSALETAPQVTVANLNTSEIACPGEVISASAGVSGATGTVTYSWVSEILSGGGGALSFSSSSSSSTSITIPSSLPSTTIYKVTLTITDTPTGGCANPITAKYISTITVNSSMTILESHQDISCIGASDGEIDVTVSGGSPAYTFSWTGPNGFVSSNEDLTGLNSGTYNLTVTDQNGCTNPSAIQITLNDTVGPIAIITGNEELTCDNVNVTLDASTSSSNGQGALSYLWNTGETTSSITFETPGTYSVIVTSTNGCTDSTEVTVTQDVLQPTAIIVGGDFCENTSTILDASTSVVQGTASYLWSTGETTASIVVTTSDTYIVTVTDSDNGCSESIWLAVTATPEPNAGSDGTLTVCAGTTPSESDLFAALTGADTGGTWSNVGLVYTYTVTATLPCTDADTSTVTVTEQAEPNADAPEDVTACDTYILPSLTAGNYFTESGGLGEALSAGDDITTTMTLYVFTPATSPCTIDVENSFVVTITNSTTSEETVTACLSYTWNEIEYTESGSYIFESTNEEGCTHITTLVLTIETPQEVYASSVDLCVLDASFDISTLLMDDVISDGIWSDDMNSGGLSGTQFDPAIVNLGDYEFTYTEPGECGRIITVFVNVNDDCVVLPCSTEGTIEVSKVVTANSDGYNDTFTISELASCGFTASVQIFNRWGKRVYQSDNYQNNWDGYHDNSGLTLGTNAKLPTGTYYYVINIEGSGYKPLTGYIYLGTQ